MATVSAIDFRSALVLVDQLLLKPSGKPSSRQTKVAEALKILHKAVLEGSESQRVELSLVSYKIRAMNSILKSPEQIRDLLNAHGLQEDLEELHGMQIALPETEKEKSTRMLTAVPRGIFSTFVDVSLLPMAGAVLGVSQVSKMQFDPDSPKKDKVPILLIHGSGFNETEWVIGRQFLKGKQFGSVFSLNLDGLLSNHPSKGIHDYASGKVRDKILQIQEATLQKEIILIGHSMGGLVAGYYAEEYALIDQVVVKQIITIGTPWKGAPGMSLLEKVSHLSTKDAQMKVESPFLKSLVSKALESEKAGKRKYYNVGSTTDFMVPAPCSTLTEDPRRQYTLSYLGHYGLIVSPRVWMQIRSWISPA